MNTTERARKVTTLTKLLQGNPQPLRTLQPPLTPDLDQFSVEELDRIRRLQEAHCFDRDHTVPSVEVERLLAGRVIRMIPKPNYPTF